MWWAVYSKDDEDEKYEQNVGLRISKHVSLGKGSTFLKWVSTK
jgi:hypothetical protein